MMMMMMMTMMMMIMIGVCMVGGIMIVDAVGGWVAS